MTIQDSSSGTSLLPLIAVVIIVIVIVGIGALVLRSRKSKTKNYSNYLNTYENTYTPKSSQPINVNIICPECGYDTGGASFCRNCGYKMK